ncbi:MAG TPA: hypothetical protein VNA24_15165 [Hyalangium sp.]|nr:hypothetical protein [Hyalangium sp.]
MPTLRNVLFAATVVGLIFSTSEAEARFGKRSSSSSSDSKKENKVHEASAVGQEPPASLDDDDEEETYSPPPRPSTDVVIVSPPPAQTYYVASTSSVEVVPQDTSSGAPVAQVSAAPEKLNSNIRLGADGAALGGGSALHLFLAFEGDRMGLDLRGTGLTLPTDDGTSGTDSITLGSVHFTYALIARDNLRVRLEGGLSGARAPDLSVTGPSIALSMEGCLTQRVDLELRAQATPFPFQQLDAQAGVALRFQALVLRTGWRGLYLNDNGLVDDVEHADAFGGPFLGLGLTF